MKKGTKLDKKATNQEVEVDPKAIRTLRTLSDKEAFHFYEGVNRPTGQSAKSLRDFSERINSVKLESLIFHLERKDFKNWAENTLEDSKLSMKLEKIPITHSNNLRTKVRSVVRQRLKELEATCDTVSIYVEEPETITV